MGEMEGKMKELRENCEGVGVEREEIVRGVYEKEELVVGVREKMKEIYCRPEIILNFATIGRLFFI